MLDPDRLTTSDGVNLCNHTIKACEIHSSEGCFSLLMSANCSSVSSNSSTRAPDKFIWLNKGYTASIKTQISADWFHISVLLLPFVLYCVRRQRNVLRPVHSYSKHTWRFKPWGNRCLQQLHCSIWINILSSFELHPHPHRHTHTHTQLFMYLIPSGTQWRSWLGHDPSPSLRRVK